jgi:hypothetical protein
MLHSGRGFLVRYHLGNNDLNDSALPIPWEIQKKGKLGDISGFREQDKTAFEYGRCRRCGTQTWKVTGSEVSKGYLARDEVTSCR